MSHLSPPARALSRRVVVHASAWSVPVVSVAATAPAFAASMNPRGTIGIMPGQFTGTRIYTPSSGEGRVNVTSLRVRNNGPSALPAGVLTYTLSIPAGWGTFTAWAGAGDPLSGWTIGGYGTSALTLAPGPSAKGLAVGEEFDLADPSTAPGLPLVFSTTRTNGGTNAATTGRVEAVVSASRAVPNEFTGDTSAGVVTGGRWAGN